MATGTAVAPQAVLAAGALRGGNSRAAGKSLSRRAPLGTPVARFKHKTEALHHAWAPRSRRESLLSALREFR